MGYLKRACLYFHLYLFYEDMQALKNMAKEVFLRIYNMDMTQH